MRINFDLGDLQTGIKIAKDAIDNKSDIDLLKGVMFEITETDKVSIKATDGVIGIKCKVPATVEDDEDEPIVGSSDARIVLPKEFVSLVNNLKGKEVVMNYDPVKHTMRINCGSNRFNLQCDSATHYPVFPDRSEIWQYELDQDIVKAALKRVSVTMADRPDDSAILKGILFEVSDQLKFASTDRFRLSTEIVVEDTEWMDDCDEVIPQEVVKILTKQLSDDNERTLKICFEDNKMYFEIGGDMDILLHSAKLHGDFPSISQVIPGSTEFDIIVNRKELLDNIKMLNPLAHDFEIRLDSDIDNEKLYITSHGTTIGRGVANMSIDEYDGDPVYLACEGNVVLKCLKALNTDKVVLGFTDTTGTATIKMNGNDNYQYIYMPVTAEITPPEELTATDEEEEIKNAEKVEVA